MKQKLSMSISFFGVSLWVFLVASIAVLIVVACAIICIWLMYYIPRRKSYKPRFSLPKSTACKHYRGVFDSYSLDKRLLSASSCNNISGQQHDLVEDGYLIGLESSGELCHATKDVCHFSLKDIEDATNGLAKENVIGSGDNGIVYLGLLPNNKRVAVKRLVCDSRQPEEFFASQMEAIGRVKHKTLVKLLGYCTEGAYRILVSEYVDNGNLHHWLHDFPGLVSSLTWNIRINIINSVAEGYKLAYLHEEQKILHGSIKSGNILLDHQWNPKISDFGLAKLLGPEWSHIIMEALGYVAPDCHSTSTLTEGNDIYSFGILIMEIVSGRIPLYHHNQPQALIVEWFKSMISNGKIAYVVDPKLPEMPSSMELKRIILVALRCVDPDVNPRLKMRDIVQMLENNLILYDEHHIVMEHCEHNHSPHNSHNPAGLDDTHLDVSRRLSSSNH